MLRKAIFASLVLSCLTAVATAAPTITAGHHILQPNTAGQVIQIMASGGQGDEFAGVDLHIVIGDGLVGPLVTAIDIIGPGTLFNGNNFGQNSYAPEYDAPGLEPTALATTQSGTVGPNGVLAFLTFDTTGIAPGVYALLLSSPIFEGSDLPPFDSFNTIRIDGTLTIPEIPEPSSIVLGMFGVTGLAAVAIRRRRARKA